MTYNLRDIHCLLKIQDYGNIMPRKLKNLFQKINWITSCFITFIMQCRLNFLISWICLQLGGIHCLVNKSVNIISVIAKDEICVKYWNPKQQGIYRIKDVFFTERTKICANYAKSIMCTVWGKTRESLSTSEKKIKIKQDENNTVLLISQLDTKKPSIFRFLRALVAKFCR